MKSREGRGRGADGHSPLHEIEKTAFSRGRGYYEKFSFVGQG